MCIPEYPVRLVLDTGLDGGFRAKDVRLTVPPVKGMELRLYFPGSNFEKEERCLHAIVSQVSWDERENLVEVDLEEDEYIVFDPALLDEAVSADPSWYDPYAPTEE